MTFAHLLHAFFSDDKILIALLLLGLDFVFGVAAALYKGTFKFAYVGDFLKNDLLGKFFPYFILYSAALVAGHAHLVIPGFDIGLLAGAVYVVLVAAFVGSILSSIKDFGLNLPAVFGSEKPPPGP